jgi:hypothetical protein
MRIGEYLMLFGSNFLVSNRKDMGILARGPLKAVRFFDS